MKQLMIITIILIGHLSSAQNGTLFNKGNDLYNSGKFDEAIEMYSQIIENGKHSAEVYFK